MGKNVKKIQDMLTGNYGGKIQVGYGDQESKHRSVGDKWTDSDGIEWEQKNGFYAKVNKLPSVGIFSKNVKIGPFCFVGPNVEVGENVELVSNVHVEGNTKIGKGTKIFPFASVFFKFSCQISQHLELFSNEKTPILI